MNVHVPLCTCHACGAKLKLDDKTCVVCGAQTYTVCPYCGRETFIRGNCRYCRRSLFVICQNVTCRKLQLITSDRSCNFCGMALPIPDLMLQIGAARIPARPAIKEPITIIKMRMR